MSLIKVSRLSFAYEGSYEQIFSDVSFALDTDWRLGFCGRNGRGKTTFLKLLLGDYEFSGTITASVAFEYFPYPVANPGQSTLDVLTAVAPAASLWQIQKELALLSVTDDVLARPFATLSNGEQTKALLAGLFLRENSFLLIDEPTNHLDLAGRAVVARYLRGKRGFILVSHDRLFLDECVDHILSINRANIEIQSGNFSSWQRNQKIRDEAEMAENERLKKDVSRLAATARRTALWSDKVEKSKKELPKSGIKVDKGYVGHKAAKMMKRAKSADKRRQKAVQEKAKLLRNLETAAPLKLHPLPYHASRLLTVENLSIAYGGAPVFNEMSFTLDQGERLALLGGNGCGKSSLLKLICGEDVRYRGTVTLGSRLAISYVPQDASFLTGDLDDYARQQGIDKTLFKAILRKLDFSRTQFEKDLRDYSAGQKKKVLLARSLCEQAHLYVWDEPLNYIDVLSRIQIEELILAYQPTLLFVEHDRAFCNNIATKTIQFK